ncbi:MAG TPA: sialidase family protein [Jatrophihabitans sp.]|nr:sialidase family protein [Jatrophihabitans sp.]
MRSASKLRAGAAIVAVVAGLTVAPWSPDAQAAPFNYSHLNKIQKRLVSGALAWTLAPHTHAAKVGGGGGDEGPGPDGLPDTPPDSYVSAGSASAPSTYVPHGNGECSTRLGRDVKVNQNCLNISDPDLQGRGQAQNETSIAQNPRNENQMVASSNDYRRGDGTCGASYSADRGRSWQDSTVPDNFTRGLGGNAREYWQAGGDTSVAWDTRGDAYLSCQIFNRGDGASPNADQSSAFVIFRSTDNGGASWNFPGRYVTVNFDPTGTSGVLEDKQLMTVDDNVNSPYRDRIYVTWTEFASDGTAYIYESHSADYGETFSAPVVVSSTSSLCTNTYNVPTPNGTCNENQFSDPFVGPDGSLYVVWANFNNAVTGNDNRNQMLLAKSTDGGQTFGAPVKVSDYYDLPDCYTTQGDDAGRACVPEKGSSTKSVFRATNYPVGSVDPNNDQRVVVTFGSYINRYSNESNGCTPTGFSQFGTNTYTGVKTAGACNNDILVSVSDDGGATFTGTTTDPRQLTSVTQQPAQRTTDQFWQWSGYSSKGVFAVSYYDRQYGQDEFNGSSDESLSASRNLTSFDSTRVTSSSMPAPTEFYGTKGGLFYGDYAGMAVGKSHAYPVWSDTRSKDLFLCPGSATGPGNPPQLCTGVEPNGQTANDQDMYTATVPLGEAHGHSSSR